VRIDSKAIRLHVEGDRLGQDAGLGATDTLSGDIAAWSGAIFTTCVGGRSLETLFPKIGLELGNPTVTFVDPKGRRRTMQDGEWL
jgi:hypothetical protein